MQISSLLENKPNNIGKQCQVVIPCAYMMKWSKFGSAWSQNLPFVFLWKSGHPLCINLICIIYMRWHLILAELGPSWTGGGLFSFHCLVFSSFLFLLRHSYEIMPSQVFHFSCLLAYHVLYWFRKKEWKKEWIWWIAMKNIPNLPLGSLTFACKSYQPLRFPLYHVVST